MSHGALAARLGVRAYLLLRSWVDRLAPAELLLAERITGVAGTAVAGALVASGLAARLDDTPRTAPALVGGSTLEHDIAERLLRGGAAVGLVDRTGSGFRRNRLTRLLATEAPRSLGPLATYFASESNLRAWSRFVEAVRRAEVPFRLAHGRGVWEHLASSEEESAEFGRAMDAVTRLDAETVVRTPGFSGLPVLCDVAGGTGALLEAALRAHPGCRACWWMLRGWCSSPAGASSARGCSGGCGSSWETSSPPSPEGLPAYVLKDVLHDWDDARATALLAVVRRAMRPGARLLLVELLLERGALESLAALTDLQMLAVTDGGRQRSVEQLALLLRRAGFSAPVVHRTSTPSSVLVSEAV